MRPAAACPAAARLCHVPIRTCVGCGRKAAKPSLLRMVVSQGTVEVDASAPGRGAHCCPDLRCLNKILHREAAPLARALRRRPQQVQVDEDALVAAVTAAAHDEPRREGVST